MSEALLNSLPTPVALVCGSGALNAAAQAGMIKALGSWRPDLAIGSSGGALTVGCMFTHDNPAHRAHEAWHQLAESKLLHLSWGRLYSAISGRETSRQTRQMEELLHGLFGHEEFAPDGRQAMVTSNLVTGLPEIINSGRLAKGVQAAAAFPVIANPVERHGEILIDGSFTASLPVAQAYEMGAASIVACDTGRAGFSDVQEGHIRWYDVAVVSINHQVAANAAHDVATVAAHIPVVLLSVPDPFRVTMADVGSRINVGERLARQQLAGIAERWSEIKQPGVYATAEEVVSDRRLTGVVR